MDRSPERTYALAEARAIGRAAWKDDYLLIEGEIIRVVAIPDGNGYRVRFRASSLDESSAAVQDGWRLVSSLVELRERHRHRVPA